MVERRGRSPSRRLFQDLGNATTQSEIVIDDIIDRITKSECVKFRKKYHLDLNTLQPCNSATDIRSSPINNGKLRLCWSWEAINSSLVPRFYRPCLVQSKHSEKASIQVPKQPSSTPVKPTKKKAQISPPVNTFFRTVRRASSLDRSGKKTPASNAPPSRSQSLVCDTHGTSNLQIKSPKVIAVNLSFLYY